MRLTLIIYSLSSGGAERVMVNMANHWTEKGWDITILTLKDNQEPLFYDLDSRVKHRSLGIGSKSSNLIQGLVNNLKRFWVLRKTIRRNNPDAVISFMTRTNVLVLLATCFLKIPTLVCEQVFPGYSVDSGVWKLLRKFTYRRASRLIVLSESTISYFSPAIQRRTSVIPNPVFIPANGHHAPAKENPVKNEKTMMAMGRLANQKGFDLLLRAFSTLAPKFPEWSLVIWGEGELRPELEKLRNELGLQEKVQLPGLTKQPYEEMKKADLFVLSSRFEGFPVVLVESMSCGLPVISFDCPTGPRDVIQNGVNGILVPAEDIKQLAAAMDDLMGSEEKRKELAQQAPKVNEQFGLEKVMGMWESLLEERP